MSKLLVIESPGKLSKLKSILGAGWTVKASMGHVRELADAGEDNLGFELDGSGVKCDYVPRDSRSKKVLSELRAAVKAASQVYLATDPDREGEVISWHLADELKLKNPLRVTYTEITKAAVERAIASPRPLDENLVGAGRARDCLDKLVGYRGSPLVWSLGAKSVGRVQSATLRLVCDREREIVSFVPETYYSVWVEYAEGFKAFYKRSLESKRSKSSAEDDSSDDAAKSTDAKAPESDRVRDKTEAEQLVAIARSHPHRVIKLESKTTPIKPPAPFTTSTLQQAAGSRLSLSPERTMQLSQKLYERGYITYMRTDSVALSDEFCASVQRYLKQHDPNNASDNATKHRTRKNAQEAHEAIRPTRVELIPSQLALQVDASEAKLYDLIWHRAVASLCAPAIVEKTRVISQSGSAYWQALGQVLKTPGYTVYWNNLSGDKELPILCEGQALTLKAAGADEKQTSPPPRYTEPKLVQLMERLGIGRPSTYSPTIKTLKAREYVRLAKGKLQPTELGMKVSDFLEKALPDLVDVRFTANMEQQLDAIASGKLDWQRYLNTWNQECFAPALAKARGLASTATGSTGVRRKAGVKPSGVKCPKCSQEMVKVPSTKCTGGHFLSCDARASGCGAVMFLNSNTQQYELPGSSPRNKPDPSRLTEHSCPVCGSPLERHDYTSKGEAKTMLRCSNLENRRGSCKEVAFWASRGHFWSPVYGELHSNSGKSATSTPVKPRPRRGKK